MSYYTHVTIEFSSEPPAVEEASEIARAWLTEQRVYAVSDVLENLARGWETGRTQFKGMVSQDIERLMQAISEEYPDLLIYVRGMGEEFEDVWLRQFQGGMTVFRLGPFEKGDEKSDE